MPGFGRKVSGDELRRWFEYQEIDTRKKVAKVLAKHLHDTLGESKWLDLVNPPLDEALADAVEESLSPLEADSSQVVNMHQPSQQHKMSSRSRPLMSISKGEFFIFHLGQPHVMERDHIEKILTLPQAEQRMAIQRLLKVIAGRHRGVRRRHEHRVVSKLMYETDRLAGAW
eukprot:SAG31_NODE_1366_length_8621_cov_4.579911_4_plen_171_part_00